MASLVSVKGLRKSFGDLEILKGIDLEVRRGEVLSIIGPSGSGKPRFFAALISWNVLQEAESILMDRTCAKKGLMDKLNTPPNAI